MKWLLAIEEAYKENDKGSSTLSLVYREAVGQSKWKLLP